MTKSEILKSVRRDLKKQAEVSYKKGAQNFFTESIKLYGVRTPRVRKIAAKYWYEVKLLEKAEIFSLAEQLIKTGYNEEQTVGFAWVLKNKDEFAPADFKRFENWISKYITNWGGIDDFCTHTVGEFLMRFPKFLPKVKAWAKSSNRWLRRAAAVSLIVPAYKGKFHKNVFETADILLEDKEDLVQKGYGWMLKVTADSNQKRVFNYVIKNKARMPRTALRYAIEKMPKSLKAKAMAS